MASLCYVAHFVSSDCSAQCHPDSINTTPSLVDLDSTKVGSYVEAVNFCQLCLKFSVGEAWKEVMRTRSCLDFRPNFWL